MLDWGVSRRVPLAGILNGVAKGRCAVTEVK